MSKIRSLTFALLVTFVAAGDTRFVPKSSASFVTRQSQDASNVNALLLEVRGGGCADTDPALFFKVGTGAVVEAAAMLGTLKLGSVLSTKLESQPKISGLSLTEWISIFGVIFGSAFFGSLVDGGLSAATSQLIDPNVTPGDPMWYSSLQKPSWNPPGWVFPIMWLIVSKPTQAVAVSRLLQTTNPEFSWKPLAVLCGHWALGDAWNKVFFGFQCLGRGVAVISVFYAALVASLFAFYQVDPVAAKFLLPTFAWVTVATCLNWNIYLNNNNN